VEQSKVSIGGGGFPASHKDSRNDLGYGRLNPKYHVEKQLGASVYPYRDPFEDLDDVETFVDEDEEEEIWDRISGPQDYDPGGGHYDPFSFVGSNTSLAGPASIGESMSPISGMVPFTKRELYPRANASTVGGTKSGTARGEGSTMAAKFDTGDRWGWSNPVYRDEESSEEDNYTLEDIAKNQEEAYLREYIRLALLEML
tara:strand:- start:266 stop:865 length:600 start_codon:yes stop_codon:yes gene_type:complete